jgi:hypothetical protein
VAANASAPLTTAGAGNTAGAFTLASNTVTVVQAGTYFIQYTASISGGTAVFALVANGAVVAGTNGVAETATGGARQIIGSTTITLAANSPVLVRNISNVADTLAATTDGQTPTSVRLTFINIG